MFAQNSIHASHDSPLLQERQVGNLLRRVSLFMNTPKPRLATISNDYDRPDAPGASLPSGMYLNYTPVSDNSIIRVRVGCYLYRGGSASDGTSVRNDYMMFRYMWQFGEEAYGHEFHRVRLRRIPSIQNRGSVLGQRKAASSALARREPPAKRLLQSQHLLARRSSRFTKLDQTL